MSIKFGFLERRPLLKDVLSFVCFVAAIILGTVILNAFVFRTYEVVGRSMEATLYPADRIIVNRLPVSAAHFMGREYVPPRGAMVVFANGGDTETMTCDPMPGVMDQYIIKRVIAFEGERVTLSDGTLRVYNEEWPDGKNVDDLWEGPTEFSSGVDEIIVPEGELYVVGDNREGTHSFDSRNGLGTVPICRIQGPVWIRFWPVSGVRMF